MEITIPLYSVLSKLIRKFTFSKSVAFFAIVLLSFTYTNLEAQISTPTSSANPVCEGAAVTFSTTVTGTSTDGLATFYDGATIIGTGAINGAGVATFAGRASSKRARA